MGSIILTWKGRCEDPAIRDTLLSDFSPIAWDNRRRWAAEAPSLPRVVRALSSERDPGLPKTFITSFDHEIRGNIALCTDIFSDPKARMAELEAQGVVFEKEDSYYPSNAYFRLKSVRLKGIEFRLYDIRGLYPGEDRFSCVFMESADYPVLNGTLVRASGPEWCKHIKAPQLAGIDWYLECPFLHLRDYFHKWTVLACSWMKYFYMPDLVYWNDEDLLGYDRHKRIFDLLQEKSNAKNAREKVAKELRRQWALEAERIEKDMASIR
jgi:hypothetical protein